MSLNFALALALFNMSSMRAGRVLLVLYALNLGAAPATNGFSDFAGAPLPNTVYPVALANKFAGVDLDPANSDLRARFNINLGNAGCLTGTSFYLGLDGNHGSEIDCERETDTELRAEGLPWRTRIGASPAR